MSYEDMNNKYKRNYSRFNKKKEKKTFTIDDIKEDLFTSMFVIRMFYTSVNFDWICINVDSIPKSKIKTITINLMELGLITGCNFTKLPDKLIESLNKTLPNYYNNVDRKTGIAYLKNTKLHQICTEYLKAEIENKWIESETFLNHLIKLENEYGIQQELIKKIDYENKNQLERFIKYPDGTKAEVKTTKFWKLRLEHKKFKKQLLLEGVSEPKMSEETIKQTKQLTEEEKRARYNARCGVTE